MRIIAVIPTLNEAKYIGQSVWSARKYVGEVIVSDGSSTDATADIADGAGAKVIVGSKGYGIQLKRGLLFAQRLGADIVIFLDGDMQHNPEDIPRMLRPITDGMADVVIGCRGKSAPAYRRFGAGVLSYLCQVGHKEKILDAMSGYWAIRSDKIPPITTKGWGASLEILIKLRGNGVRFACVDTPFTYHKEYSDNSHSGAIRLGLAHLWAIIKLRFKYEVLHATT